MMKQLLAVLLLSILAVSFVQATPTTHPATNIGTNNFTFNGNGASGTVGWFVWGMDTGAAWAHTPNVTAGSGLINYTMKGTPVFGSTKYYYKACDITGCGSEVSFTTVVVTPLPQVINGDIVQNMTENQFDAGNMVWNSLQVYIQVTGATIFYGFIFALVFVGLWLRTRGTAVAQIFGMICVGLFASTAVGLQLGLPPEFLAVGQALLYLSLTGAIMAFTFK
jgi:hypothetical protein